MYEYCERHGVSHEQCGKVIVAHRAAELPALDELERRGRANGVAGLVRLDTEGIAEREPHCRGVARLHSPDTGIVDFAVVARAIAGELLQQGVEVATRTPVTGVTAGRGRVALRHAGGETQARLAVFCAGGESDRLAEMAGAPPDPRIVPFRGAYLRLRPERRHLVRSMIYPVPDPALPYGPPLVADRRCAGAQMPSPQPPSCARRPPTSPSWVRATSSHGSRECARRRWAATAPWWMTS